MSVELRVTLSEEGIASLSERLGEPAWLREKRLAAFRAYKEMEMPAWDRTDLAGVDLDKVALTEPGAPITDESELPEALRAASGGERESHRIFQVDAGRTFLQIGKELEADGVIVCDFATALAEHGDLLKDHYMSAVPYDEDKLTALHYAAASTGVFIYVPKNVAVELPIEIRTYTSRPGLSLFPHVLVVAERGAEVTVVEGVASDDGDEQRIVGQIVELCPAEGAQIRFAAVQTWGERTFNFTTRRSILSRDARVEWLAGDFGSALSRSHARSVLEGPGSESTNLSVFFGGGTQHLDVGITMLHVGEHTASDMVTKGVLADRARAVYRGLTDIENGARFASGFQRENTMLLSEEARSDAIPGLEIDETEVQAGHAATTGQIDKVQLFYLMSRGLPKQDAMHLIVAGFFDPVLQRIPIESVQEELRALIDGKMRG